MTQFQQKFTPLQIQKLNSGGFADLYSFITYLPFDLSTIKPLLNNHSSPAEKVLYLYTGKLQNIDHRKNKQKFLVLDFSGKFNIKCYLFSVASYTLKALQIDQTYQLLLSYNQASGLWSLEKFASFKFSSNAKNFILGQALEQEYLLPKYAKTGQMRNGDFQAIHKRLLDSDYVLNLKGLVPKSEILPEVLNLAEIHKPTSVKDYNLCVHRWVSLKVYLRLALLKYIDKNNQETMAYTGKVDLDFLKRLTASLPFTLSSSQKTVIWDILKEILVVE